MSIFSKLKELMVKMKIVNSMAGVSEHPLVNENSEMDKLIEKWMKMYRGADKDRIASIDDEDVIDNRMTLNIPKMITNEMSSLIFNEKFEVNVSDKQVNDYIEGVFNDNKIYKTIQDAGEKMFALGGLMIKAHVHKKKIKLSYVYADSFKILTTERGEVKEVVFLNTFEKGKNRYLHLEFHLRDEDTNDYIIRNEIYRETSSGYIGEQIREHYEKLEEEVRIKNLKCNLFVYIKPNISNNIDMRAVEGISIYANAVDTIRVIDEAFDSLFNDFELGRRKLYIPSSYLKEVIDPATGKGHVYLDKREKAYEIFNDENSENKEIKEVQSSIRVDEHIEGINALLNILAAQLGFSAGTFTYNNGSMKTATEVISEQSKTFKSKQSHQNIIESSLQELVYTIVELSRIYDIYYCECELKVTVNFDDSIANDDLSEIDKQTKMLAIGAQSLRRSIMKIHGVTEEEAIRIMKEIEDDAKKLPVSDEEVGN